MPAGASIDGTQLEAALASQRPRVHRLVRSLVPDAGAADDLTQETLLRAHQQLDTLEDPAALGAWLLRIARNVCTDFLRETSRRGSREGEALTEALPWEGEGSDALVDRAAMNACGEELLHRLPPRYRRVLVLHDLLGLTSVEIGRLLRCTPGSVKIRLHRARRLFRAELEQGCDFQRDERGALVGAPKPTRG